MARKNPLISVGDIGHGDARSLLAPRSVRQASGCSSLSAECIWCRGEKNIGSPAFKPSARSRGPDHKSSSGRAQEPGYLELSARGELKERAAAAVQRLRECQICPRRCGVDRIGGLHGNFCHAARLAMVSSFGPHHGEERVLSGRSGSGTIFFTYCSLGCVFCQNYQLSHLGEGRETTAEELAEIMLRLQKMGCHNINLVTPTHFVPQILEALVLAAPEGLRLPLVYNTGAYEELETLALLDGVVDIYMPDFKYWDSEVAAKLSSARDYPELARAAVKEMHRQVGDLHVDKDGLAVRGLILRHLVLPGGLSGSKELFEFVARDLSCRTYLNIMNQYRPHFRAHEFPPLDRPLSSEDYEQAVRSALRLQLRRLDGMSR